MNAEVIEDNRVPSRFSSRRFPARAFLRVCLAPSYLAALFLAVLSGSVDMRADAPAESAPIDASEAADARLRERIQDMVVGMRDVPLPVIVEALAGHEVLPWNGEERETLRAVAETVRATIERGGLEAARMNEAGNRVEEIVLEALREHGFEAGRPAGPSGHVRSAGYPDLEASLKDRAFYVEVKAYSPATVDSTQRSFYLSPSVDFKVTRDAVHLLVAVELIPASRGTYRAQTVRWLDLSGLRCDLKYEFNASNRDLYRPESGLVIVDLPRDGGTAVTSVESAP